VGTAATSPMDLCFFLFMTGNMESFAEQAESTACRMQTPQARTFTKTSNRVKGPQPVKYIEKCFVRQTAQAWQLQLSPALN